MLFDAPLVNPSPGGLFSATSWQEATEGAPLRWLTDGLVIRNHNFPGGEAVGVWAASWKVRESDLGPQDVKDLVLRPDDLDPFMAVTVWASDRCDLSAVSRAEVRQRAQQNLRLLEPVTVEKQFAARLLEDAGTPDTATDIVSAVGHLEELFAITNTVGYVHARPSWQASAAQANLLRYNGGRSTTPAGHTWVFGGGYAGADGLDDVLVATSPTFGWRGQVELRDGDDFDANQYYALVERSLVVGYEHPVGAVDVTG